MRSTDNCLLLLSPFGPELWEDMLPFLFADVSVYALFPRMGSSVLQIAEEVLGSIDREIHAVGLCMGGNVVAAMKATAPKQVRGIALISTRLKADRQQLRARRVERIAGLTEKARLMEFPDQVYVEHAARWMTSEHSHGNKTFQYRVAGILRNVPLRATIAQQIAMLGREDLSDWDGGPGMQVLAIAGRDDRICPIEEQGNFLTAQASDIHVLDVCGHLPPIEQPLATSALINSWVMEGE